MDSVIMKSNEYFKQFMPTLEELDSYFSQENRENGASMGGEIYPGYSLNDHKAYFEYENRRKINRIADSVLMDIVIEMSGPKEDVVETPAKNLVGA